MSNGWVELKLKLLKWVDIEVGLGLDSPKFTLGSNGLGSNGLKNGLNLDPFKVNEMPLSVIFYYYLFSIFSNFDPSRGGTKLFMTSWD